MGKKNEVAEVKSQVPTGFCGEDQVDDDPDFPISDNTKGIRLSFPQIKMLANVQQFMLPDEELIKEVSGVIIESRSTRNYWSSTGENQLICTSKNGIFPDPTACSNVQNEKCSRCNHFGFESNCKNNREIYILTPKNPIPYIIILSPTSLKHYDGYMRALTVKNIHRALAFTKITLEKESNDSFSYSIPKFELLGMVTTSDDRQVIKKAMVQMGEMFSEAENKAKKALIEEYKAIKEERANRITPPVIEMDPNPVKKDTLKATPPVDSPTVDQISEEEVPF